MKRSRMLRCSALTILLGSFLGAPLAGHATEPGKAKKVVLIAGKKSHGPGVHEYEKSIRLLKVMLDRSPNLDGIKTEIHFNGWPEAPTTLDDADTIMVISDGQDGDAFSPVPFMTPERMTVMQKQMDRGCGLITFHFSTFAADLYGRKMLDWCGGYFDWQNDAGERDWYSAIKTLDTEVTVGSPDHAVTRGIADWKFRDEFYYRIRFRENDPRLVPILRVPALGGSPREQIVAWAVQRTNGGRGFGTTTGHFYDNWKDANYRRLILNAIVWTAGAQVPEGGVRSSFYTDNEVARVLAGAKMPDTIDAVIVTGHHHPGHNWKETTAALEEALRRDPRMVVTTVADPEFLASKKLHDYDVIIFNYCNWERPGLSEAAKRNFVSFLKEGGGLTLIHFSNGAFHFSLPGAQASDWPEYRNICRRVWNHQPSKTSGQNSGHDPYGPLRIDIADPDHPITKGMTSFETIDELYFHQDGAKPIHVLATARSKITKNDEPMAFVYDYGKGRVFQTLLGHAAESLRTRGAAELVRRAAAWAAGKQPFHVKRTTPAAAPAVASVTDKANTFGKTLDTRKQVGQSEGKKRYQDPPLTVECQARLRGKNAFNILVANGNKASSKHWELYSVAGSGTFSVFLPGITPNTIDSGVNITDDRWHHVAMVYEPRRVRLYVDAKQVADRKVSGPTGEATPGPLWFGAYPPQSLRCDGQIDEVRISNTAREIKTVPTGPLQADEYTIGLWRFDRVEKKTYRDVSKTDNPARIVPAAQLPAAVAPSVVIPGGPRDYPPADERLSVHLVDRSQTESYLGVRLDTAGRIFAGGREALFVYEPKSDGSYSKPKELVRFPANSWITDIEIRGDDLYVMTPAALYRLPDARRASGPVKAERLIWGIPLDLHVSFHGLAWGPQGDLYFSSGDPLLNYGDFSRADHWGHWTIFSQPDRTRTAYTGSGGVFRCKPDGSGFHVVARGTRGCCGLVFDRNWNLFTSDNDHESRPADYVPARLLHVAPHTDFNWPRGWMAHKTPDRADVVRTVFAGLGRGVPVGQSYYDETYLPAEFRNNLLMARWGRLTLTRYPLRERGASFEADEHFVLNGHNHARPVSVTVGRGGRIFATIAYMARNEGSPTYITDLVMITRKDDPPTHPFEGYEAPDVAPDKLWVELSNPSWWRRNRAHAEILRRGGKLLSEATRRLAKMKRDDPARGHLPWLAAAEGSEQARKLLTALASSDDVEVRRQSVRALQASALRDSSRTVFEKALTDSDSAVRRAALVAFFDLPGSFPQSLVAEVARSTDTYLRQAATLLLARRASTDALRGMCKSNDGPTRLAGVLAVGLRLTVPPADAAVPKGMTIDYKHANAHTAIQYADATIELKKLGPIGSYTMAEAWARTEHTPEQDASFALLVDQLKDKEEQVRLQAAYFLSLLRDARSEPLIKKVWTQNVERKLAALPNRGIDQVWLVGPFPDGDQGLDRVHTPEKTAVDLSAEYNVGDDKLAWQKSASDGRFDLSKILGRKEHSSCYAYTRLQSMTAQRVMLLLGYDDGVKLWCNGRAVWTNAGVRGAAASQDTVMLDLEPGSNDLLIRVQNVTGDAKMHLYFRAVGKVAAVLPERLGAATLAQRLKAAGTDASGNEIGPEFLEVDWTKAAAEGDPEMGRKLFGPDGLGCIKCHAATGEQAGGGAPSLTDAGKRFTVPHLVESILLPSKQVAPVFLATLLETNDGQSPSGLIVSETADEIEMLIANGTRIKIRTKSVTKRRTLKLSPMPQGLVQKPQELRDILAYLLADKPAE